MADGRTRNPYIDYSTSKETAILSGAKITITPGVPNAREAGERLRRYQYYLCENQQTLADVLLVMDIRKAADALLHPDALEAKKDELF